ncbi:hypothetical protein [Methylorubrum sp. POS3]|uniref:hypothetical protein n=1 Tax=Methylorubrum sp. POS3 TaxID=2998492 RepID=UPI00372A51B8
MDPEAWRAATPKIPTYRLRGSERSGFIEVMVGQGMTGRLIRDEEHTGTWRVEDPEGHLMGRTRDQHDGAAFLAAWFFAADDGDK